MKTPYTNNFKIKCSYQIPSLQSKTCPISCILEYKYFLFFHVDIELLIILTKKNINETLNLKCYVTTI